MNGHIEQQSQRTAAHLERFDTVIIGGGQAGLATGYHLAERDLPFVILDANERIGDAWRKRWDSLRLFTPARYDGLQGGRFPAPALSFPTKDEMADYLQSYAARFDLPVRSGVKVDGLSREGDRFVITSGNRRFEAKHVVVATGAYQVPKVPAFADELRSSIVQLHSSQYHRPSQLQSGDRFRGVTHASHIPLWQTLGTDPCPSRTRCGAVRPPRGAVRRPPCPDIEDANREEGSTQVYLPRRAARPCQAEGPRCRRSRAGA